MKKISFHRVDYATPAELESWVRERSLPSSSIDLKGTVREGDYVLAALFDFYTKTGQVRAVGRVMRSDAALDIEWRAESFDLHPTQQGCRFWLKSNFRFADSVAGRYMLEKKCTGIFFDVKTNGGCSDSIAIEAVISSAPAELF